MQGFPLVYCWVFSSYRLNYSQHQLLFSLFRVCDACLLFTDRSTAIQFALDRWSELRTKSLFETFLRYRRSKCYTFILIHSGSRSRSFLFIHGHLRFHSHILSLKWRVFFCVMLYSLYKPEQRNVKLENSIVQVLVLILIKQREGDLSYSKFYRQTQLSNCVNNYVTMTSA